MISPYRRQKHILNKNIFNYLHHYSKYVSIATMTIDKIFRHKIKLFSTAEAISSGVFDICEFINESNILSKYDGLSCLNADALELLALLQDKLNKRFIKLSNNLSYYEYKLLTKKILVSINLYRNNISEVFCEKDETDIVLDEIGQLFWKTYSNNILLGITQSYHKYDDDPGLFARPDDFSGFDDFHSKEFYEANDYIKQFFYKGKNRAVIFYGNPGVGKSTIIRQIAKDLNVRSMRISIDSFKSFDVERTFNIINILKPQVLIIDDFDKIEMTTSMLPIFEKLHKQIKLTMISVNNLNYFEDNIGLVRPERFDKFIKVERLDNVVIEKIISKKYMYLADKIKEWPAAYIRELKENIDVLGDENIDKYLEELNGRIEFQNKERPAKSRKKLSNMEDE